MTQQDVHSLRAYGEQNAQNLKEIPGKDEKRLIDNLGMPGNFRYIKVRFLNYDDNENDNKQGS